MGAQKIGFLANLLYSLSNFPGLGFLRTYADKARASSDKMTYYKSKVEITKSNVKDVKSKAGSLKGK